MNSLPTVPLSSSRDANAPSETSQLSFEDQAVLARAMRELERTSLAIRLSTIIGRQVSAIGSIIPANISEIANKATTRPRDDQADAPPVIIHPPNRQAGLRTNFAHQPADHQARSDPYGGGLVQATRRSPELVEEAD
jgi:hypothetical protein